jgi:DNA-binding transcriptional ArsR family regulator
MSLPAVIKHLDILTDAGLVTRTRVGRNVQCRLTPEPMGEAVDWLAKHLKFWDTRLDALQALIEAKKHD